ncbi:efflux RND transporter permease subunit [Myxococcota bacterium]|nr:efflux RND transporter permease subunit [Myxococcota bacterium]
MIASLVRMGPAVLVATISILVFGSISYVSLPREAAPDVKIPVVMVSTPYIGVSPADVEALVTIPIENELSSLKDVKKMSSTSAEGVSIVSLEFEPEVVIEDALQRVRDRVNRAQSKVPEDAEDPDIREISFSDWPIFIITIAGQVDEDVLKGIGEALGDEVAKIPGVLEARVSGGLERQIRVQVDPTRLSHYELSLSDVIGAIGNENVNVPGGEVGAGTASFLLRVPGEFEAARDVEQVAIKRVGDRPVFVRDVARVVDGYEDRETYARMNGRPAVSLAVTKRAGASIVDIARDAKAMAARAAEGWPEGVEYRVLADQSRQIEDMVADLENNIITALILVVGVLLFFMGVRNSLFVALSIPLAMWMSFMVIEALGLTLNMIVLFSLILALGMLVDNAIVIVENIYRHMEEGKDLFAASIDGTREVAMAVIASTATTVAAFLPLVFWTGIMGQFMGYLPKTVIIVLTASLVAAIGILPVLTARAMKRTRRDGAEPPQGRFMARYQGMLRWTLARPKATLGGALGVLVGTFVAYGFLNHGTEFFPDTEPDRAVISVRLPDGMDLETTDGVVRRIEGILARDPNVDVYVAESGVGGGGGSFGGSQAVSSQAQITVDFLPHRNNTAEGGKSRVESSRESIKRIRAAVADIPGAEISVDQEQNGPPVGAAIAVEVSGDDFHQVGALAAKARRDLSAIPGVTELRDDYKVGRPEMRFRIDRGAAQRVGASTNGVAGAVRTAVAGTKASVLREGEDEYDIVVELAPEWRADLQKVLDLRFPGREDTAPGSFPVPLSAVASYELAAGSGSIRHVDQDLVVTIEGDVLQGFNQNAVRAQVQDAIGKAAPPQGYALRLGGADDEQRDAQEFLGRAFLIALALISLVLIAQFNAFSQPVIILSSVVMSLVGVLWGLILTGTSFGVIMTGIGVISLAGVVVNNAIVLLDYVDQLRARGVGLEEALVQAGLTRFRPVLLTAVTTILGLVPMAVGVSVDFRRARLLIGGSSAEWWGPMAVAVIFGLAFATVLTLVLVPTLYKLWDDTGRWVRGLFSRGRPGAIRGLDDEADDGDAAAAPAAAKGLGLAVLGAGLGLLAALAPAPVAALTLSEALAAAEGHNVEFAIAREQARGMEALKGQALSAISPRLDASGSYTINQYETTLDFTEQIPEEFQDFFEDSGEPTVIQEKAYGAASLTLTQPLFNGAAFPALLSANRTIDAARHDEAATRSRVRASVARAFYALAVAREARQIAEQSVELARRQMELASRRVVAGSVAARALLQARLALSRADRDLAGARQQESQSALAFTRATGLPGGTPLSLDEPIEVPPDVAGALEEASARRPDLRAAVQRERAVRHELTARAFTWLPSVDGRFIVNATENTGFSAEPVQWMLLFQANWSLWDGGMRLAQLRQKRAEVRLAGLLVERQRQQVDEDVRNAYERLARSESALATVAEELALAEENLRLAEIEFSAGSNTWVEVELARASLLAARLARVQERASRDLAAVEVRVATGTW